MPAIETALYTCLTASTALANLVGSAIFPVKRLQQQTGPCVVYRRSEGERVWSLGGYCDLENPRIDIDICTTSVEQLRTVGDAVVNALSSGEFEAVINQSPGDYWDDVVGEYIRSYTVSIWIQA